VVALLVFVVEADILHGISTTTDLTSGQWLAGSPIGSAILWVGEALELVLRLGGARSR